MDQESFGVFAIDISLGSREDSVVPWFVKRELRQAGTLPLEEGAGVAILGADAENGRVLSAWLLRNSKIIAELRGQACRRSSS